MLPVYLIVRRGAEHLIPYVGCVLKEGKTIEHRFREHCSGQGGAPYLARAMKKYGKEYFTIEQIDAGSTPEQTLDLERWWIKRLGSEAPNGYNLTIGGRGNRGLRWTPEARAKMAARMTGRRHSSKTIRRMQEAANTPEQTATRSKKDARHARSEKGRQVVGSNASKDEGVRKGSLHNCETRGIKLENARGDNMKSKLLKSRQLAEQLAQAANVLPEQQSSQRFTMKRVPTPPKPSPYVEMELRREYAWETMRSIKASPVEQVVELEFAYNTEDEDA